MIPGPNGQPGAYRLSISAQVAGELAALGKRASHEGWFEAYKTALLEIDRRLKRQVRTVLARENARDKTRRASIIRAGIG